MSNTDAENDETDNTINDDHDDADDDEHNCDNNSNIRPLAQSTVQRIVAEQAITDLSGIVKELVDNAIDAGSKCINVRLFGQGLHIIEVSDDGSGIPEQSRPLVATRYATSKIQSLDDIYNTPSQSLGFRGEALFSMASLSETLIIATRTKNDALAVKLQYGRDGALLQGSSSQTQIARKIGTTVAVVKPFHALPARRADMARRIRAERTKIFKLMQSYAIFHTGKRISLIDVVSSSSGSREDVAVATSQNSTKLQETISSVLGHNFLSTLTPLTIDLSSIAENAKEQPPSTSTTSNNNTKWSITGYISKSSSTTTTKQPPISVHYYSINNRPVNLPNVTKLLRQFWASTNTTKKKSSSAILQFHIPNNTYDINISPDKRQVLFLYEKEIMNVIYERLLSINHNINTYHSPASIPLLHQLQVRVLLENDSSKTTTTNATTTTMTERHKRRNAFVHDLSTAKMQHESEARRLVSNDEVVVETVLVNGDSDSDDDTQNEQQTQDDRMMKRRRVSRDHEIVVDETTTRALKPASDDRPYAQGRRISRETESVGGEKDHPTSPTPPPAAADSKDAHGIQTPPTRKSIVEAPASSLFQRKPTTLRSSSSSSSPPPPQQSANTTPPSKPTSPQRQTPSSSPTQRFANPYAFQRVKSNKSNRTSDMDIRKWITMKEKFNKGQDDDDSKKTNRDDIVDDHGDDQESTRNRRILDPKSPTSVARKRDFSEYASATSTSATTTNASNPLAQFAASASSLQNPLAQFSFRPASKLPLSPCNSHSDNSENGKSNNDAHKADDDTAKQAIVWDAYQSTEHVAHEARIHRVEMRKRKLALRRIHPTSSNSEDEDDVANLRKGEGGVVADGAGAGTGAPSSTQTSNASQSDADRGVVRLSKDNFREMQVLGQFNMGFILAKCPNNNLWILDQHACDEKYNFERLIKTTVMHEQRLIHPMPLELNSSEEACILDNIDIFESNGFRFAFDPAAPIRQRLKLTALPHSGAQDGRKAVQFGKDDVSTLCAILTEGSMYEGGDGGTGTDGSGRYGNNAVRRYATASQSLTSTPAAAAAAPSSSSSSTTATASNISTKQKPDQILARLPKAIAMFASRACRTSIMIGTALSQKEMEQVVQRLADVEQPWNCPHGRPTMRHVGDIFKIIRNDERQEQEYYTGPTATITRPTQLSQESCSSQDGA
eukprot:CAMPEP_0119572938 /NCGR_PEP_ID=MMETSP1352-20130426/44872_1 /TAXON_ID=265584 /ORGANISM="Stauroneis constricta, Strain CCMP1120" /LENGTH=1181 /DNA_ID=CAMNT_0007622625 /DNA_START=673 /DNA_END=4218 /DNA_ORIENTATION=+